MANKPAKVWIPIVIIAVVTVVVVCFCIILALLYCVWYALDSGILREDAGTVEEPVNVEAPGRKAEEPVTVKDPGRKVEEPGTVEEPEPYGPPGVTLANFERIKAGMPYREVVAIFGCEGTLKSISKTSPGRPDMRHYKWRDREGGWAYVTFVDGLLFGASQYDLQ